MISSVLPQKWSEETTSALIDHLLENYHARHREHLPTLIKLARKVEQTHGDHPECPAGLTQYLISMEQELDSHMLKEEQILFPMLRHNGHARARGPISVMLMEHQEHDQSMKRLLTLTRFLKVPNNACLTWASLYEELGQFIDELSQHIQLENEVLFAGQTLDAQAVS
ncbi:regulator of cell morphogenesis and NO signaling [Marinospirillum celere]|uniref:Regulator of cell morphogenesis and NO signaling n=1 Tax=Marinospirillum celere TaxID=1122252 RepID=A0A1I1HY31_9GAMM|nr:hemerythrin domain-containing protein [Marinospirillum celere]SFC26888.1 regulator of cell morphogenesis and NO signaling [Marinospirillum celere]